MKLSDDDYKKLEENIQKKGKEIFEEIKGKYKKYLSDVDKIKSLENNNGKIVVDRYNEDDIELFGGIDRVPAGHSGRRKMDDTIHLYPYSPQLSFVEKIDDLQNLLINDVVIHEIFHFYIQPDLYDKSDSMHGDDVFFGHCLTEGLVQFFTEIYINRHNLGKSYTTYKEEVLLVQNILDDLKNQGLSDDELATILLNDNQDEIMNKCMNGKKIKKEFIAKYKIHNQVRGLLKENFSNLSSDRLQQEFFHYCSTEVDMDELYKNLVVKFPSLIVKIDNIFEEYYNLNIEKQRIS